MWKIIGSALDNNLRLGVASIIYADNEHSVVYAQGPRDALARVVERVKSDSHHTILFDEPAELIVAPAKTQAGMSFYDGTQVTRHDAATNLRHYLEEVRRTGSPHDAARLGHLLVALPVVGFFADDAAGD